MTSNLLDPNDSGPSSLPIIDFCDHVKTNADMYSHYWVLKMEHCKRKHGVQHEFLVVTVVNTQHDSNPQSQVCLERGRGRANRWWHPLSSLGPAKDQISRWSSNRGDEKTKANGDKMGKGNKLFADGSMDDLGLWQLSSLRVPDTTTFAIRDLCLILQVVTSMAPQYDVKDYQCYWFCLAVLALARMALPGLSQEWGRDSNRAGKNKIQILDMGRAKRNLDELMKREEEEEPSDLEAVNETFKKAIAGDSPEVLSEANRKAVTAIIATSRAIQDEANGGDVLAIRGAMNRARQEAAWEAEVEAMSPVSKAFARASRDIEPDLRSTNDRWDDGSWSVGFEWRPTTSTDVPNPPKRAAVDSKW